MAREREEITVDLNVFVGGYGKLGVANSFKAPVVDMTGVESNSSSAGKMNCYYGAVENLEAEFTLGKHDPLIYEEMGKLNDGEFIFKQSLKNCPDKSKVVEYILRGQISSIDDGEAKRGEKVGATIKMGSLWYYKKSIGGKSVYEIDKENGIVRINGKDILQDARNAVMS